MSPVIYLWNWLCDIVLSLAHTSPLRPPPHPLAYVTLDAVYS